MIAFPNNHKTLYYKYLQYTIYATKWDPGFLRVKAVKRWRTDTAERLDTFRQHGPGLNCTIKKRKKKKRKKKKTFHGAAQ